MKNIIFIVLLSSLCFGKTFNYPLNCFYTNLLSESGVRYIEVNIVLSIQKDSYLALADQQKWKIRDIILGILSSNTMENISTIKGKSRLKGRIIKAINTSIKKDFVSGVYFTHFIFDPRTNNKEDKLYEKLDDINDNIKTLINIIANKP